MSTSHFSSSPMVRNQAAIIMAAGKGTRMKSKLTKILHPVAGIPIIEHVVQTSLQAQIHKLIIVLGYQADAVQDHLLKRFPKVEFTWVIQEKQLGTAHAVQCALPALEEFEGDIWILSGDVPTLQVHHFDVLQKAGQPSNEEAHTDQSGAQTASLVVAGMSLSNPKSYGRLLCDEQGLYAIREARDCTLEELEVCDVNAGLYRVDSEFLKQGLATLKSDNAQSEYYLTDLVEYARTTNHQIAYSLFENEHADDLEGVNHRADLALAEARLQKRLVYQAMMEGVTFLDPKSVYLHAAVKWAPDITVEPNVMVMGESSIGEGSYIEQGCKIIHTHLSSHVHLGQGSYLEQTHVESQAHILPYSHIFMSRLGSKVQVGPFARLREHTHLESKVKVGNFVETKKAYFNSGSKASHLSYLGDVQVGEKANIGAGTITCNYDGYRKHTTQIGAHAFIGSDTQLVAPVQIGEGAFVAAGTTVTQDVEPHSLVLTRSPQVEKQKWAQRYHQQQAQTKS